MSEPSAPSRRRATPTQITVVISLAVLLTVLLYAWLVDQREKARIANCMSNLRGLGFSVAMYADLYGHRCPDAGHGKPAWDHFNLITNVTSSGKIFHCPSDRGRTPKAAHHPGDALTHENVSYGYVAGLQWQVQTDSIFMFDRNPYSTTKGSGWNLNSPHGRSGGGQLFLDGHVEFKPVLQQDLKGDTVDTNP